ncbi:MAG: IS4 family transposase [Tannerella sp.]|jgi:hypothetical protein|nr:IS4 family transposase [Tannerella sp.]
MTIKKNINSEYKSTQLLAVFQAFFKDELHLARIHLICLFISSLCKVKSVNFSKLSAGFDTASKSSSNYRRIQRFIATVEFPVKLVAKLIFSLLPNKTSLTLVMDRTNWKFGEKNINILMLGVSYKNIAFPLMFKMLNKKGNSNTQERIILVQNFIDWFGSSCIECLLADREFIGEDWLNFLNINNIRYHIRIRNNFKIYVPDKQKEITAYFLFNDLRINELRHYTKIVKLHGQYCYLSGIKTINDGKLDFCIVVSFNRPDEALECYKKRWQIETLFKGFKTSGFNLEDTHVTHLDRLEKLVNLVMIAFVWCYKIGDYIDTKIKPIQIKKHGRRAVSVFRYGLDYITECLLSGFNKLNICLIKFFVVY